MTLTVLATEDGKLWINLRMAGGGTRGKRKTIRYEPDTDPPETQIEANRMDVEAERFDVKTEG